ncbi:MAG: hypothetical protein ABR528_12735 [Pseudonocardiaceae bacterium]
MRWGTAMTQWWQLIGAVLLLGGFAAAKWGALPATSVAYLAVNTVGAADLAVLALAVFGRVFRPRVGSGFGPRLV